MQVTFAHGPLQKNIKCFILCCHFRLTRTPEGTKDFWNLVVLIVLTTQGLSTTEQLTSGHTVTLCAVLILLCNSSGSWKMFDYHENDSVSMKRTVTEFNERVVDNGEWDLLASSDICDHCLCVGHKKNVWTLSKEVPRNHPSMNC